jgi:alpha-1,2-mannosyltransferase
VWVLPAVLVTGIVAWRRRNALLMVISAIGVALMRWTPIELLPKHHEASAAWWRQLAGMSYVWWALAVILAVGVTVTARGVARDSAPPRLAPVTAVG